MNPIQEKFQRGELSVGTFTQLGSPIAVECLAERAWTTFSSTRSTAPVGVEFLTAAITAADAAGITPLVRINEISRSAVLQPLDYGAQGLIVPAVETVEQVAELVRYAKFPPVGNPGLLPHPGRRLGL